MAGSQQRQLEVIAVAQHLEHPRGQNPHGGRVFQRFAVALQSRGCFLRDLLERTLERQGSVNVQPRHFEHCGVGHLSQQFRWTRRVLQRGQRGAALKQQRRLEPRLRASGVAQ